MDFVFAYITVKDADEARRIGKTLVSERLAACVNILPHMESHYWWKDALESSQEAVLIAKTRESLRDALTERARALHTAETPCIVFLPLTGGHPGYLEWLAAETEDRPGAA
jgi:periplasmic divalent cation tolerance protein